MNRLAVVLVCVACSGGPGTLDDGGVSPDPAPITWSELPPSSTDPPNDGGTQKGCYPCRNWACGVTADLPTPDAIYVEMHPTSQGCVLTRVANRSLEPSLVSPCTPTEFLNPALSQTLVTLQPQGGTLELCMGPCRSCIPWR